MCSLAPFIRRVHILLRQGLILSVFVIALFMHIPWQTVPGGGDADLYLDFLEFGHLPSFHMHMLFFSQCFFFFWAHSHINKAFCKAKPQQYHDAKQKKQADERKQKITQKVGSTANKIELQ